MLRFHLVASVAAAALLATPVMAQTVDSTSGSNSASNATNSAGAASNQQQGQTANNAGIGNSDSVSKSNSNSTANTASSSTSYGNQQGQGQGQGQTQASDAHNTQTQSQGQTASNLQGTMVSNTFNSTNLKRTYVSTNTAVPLAASSSFSSDYCGGTISGGASVAPIGVSLGASGIKIDKSCASLRRAEKFGMAAANYQNMGQPEMAMKMMSMMVWAICTSDVSGPRADKSTAEACSSLLGQNGASAPSDMSVPVPPPVPQKPVTPLETQKPNITPTPDQQQQEYLPPKTPRGENDVVPPIVATPAAPVAVNVP
jgi:hypothetical protein